MSQPVCLQCKKVIFKRPNEAVETFAKRKFCGHRCSLEGQRKVRKHFRINFASPTAEQIAEFYAL